MNKFYLIIGRKGSGKTTLATNIALNLKQKTGKKIIYIGLFPNIKFDKIIYCYDNDTFEEISYQILKKIHNVIIFIDDFDLFKSNDFFKQLLTISRHKKIDLILTCRRTRNLDMLVQNQIDYFFVFKQILPYDLKIIEELTNLKKDTFKNLKPFEYILYDFSNDNYKKSKIHLKQI